MTGTTIGHYQILEKLGEGGMGEVYKARDVLLNRTAALKFLPADSAGDKRHRFVQEAQSASALNHPNIITIYEVATAGARDFIAMELVQGQTLDEIIASKPLPLERVLTYGVQIADALAAAHAAGIVHRDLKPGNVMVTDSGMVKVLDFGLAKLMPGASSPSGVSETVLAGAPRTVEETILGTVAYMSPEQAEGKPVDHRSDIFSFGAVLLEMLTGRRAFYGESTASTLAAILTAEPPSLSMDLPGVPVELIRIIFRCLRKQSDKRWQNIADVRIALEELKQDLESGRLNAPRAAAPPARHRWWPLVASGLVAAALTGVIVWSMRPSVPAPELWSIVRLTSDAGASLFPAISRDGKLVTYVSDRAASDTMDLWVQQIEGGDPVQLTRGLGACRDPAFSPDGTRIAAYCGADPAASTSYQRWAACRGRSRKGSGRGFRRTGRRSRPSRSVRAQQDLRRPFGSPLRAAAVRRPSSSQTKASTRRRSGVQTAEASSSSVSAMPRTRRISSTGFSCPWTVAPWCRLARLSGCAPSTSGPGVI
jgi:serine/threonine protein kinase